MPRSNVTRIIHLSHKCKLAGDNSYSKTLIRMKSYRPKKAKCVELYGFEFLTCKI